MQQATYEDAGLILRLYELRREEKLRTARAWFTGTFSAKSLEEMMAQCTPGSDENAYFRMVTTYWEMAASFVVQGVLNEGLYIQSGGEGLFVFEKVRPFLEGLREAYKNPLLLKNLETVADIQVDWMNENAPGAYEAMLERIRG
jgi:hypothetical protein